MAWLPRDPMMRPMVSQDDRARKSLVGQVAGTTGKDDLIGNES